LDDAERLAAASLPHLLEECGLGGCVPVVDDGEPDHPITRIAASSRRSPWPIATPTVCSKISSSEQPAAFSSATTDRSAATCSFKPGASGSRDPPDTPSAGRSRLR